MASMSFRSLTTSAAALAALVTLLAVAPTAAGARPHPTPTPSATPSPPPEDMTVTRVARREFVAWVAGNLDHSRYTDDLNRKITTEKLTQVSTALGKLGAFIRSEYLGPIAIDGAPAGIHGYLYRMFCSQGTVYEQLILDSSGKVAGILFRDKIE